jgi:hypothetical protein
MADENMNHHLVAGIWVHVPSQTKICAFIFPVSLCEDVFMF